MANGKFPPSPSPLPLPLQPNNAPMAKSPSPPTPTLKILFSLSSFGSVTPSNSLVCFLIKFLNFL